MGTIPFPSEAVQQGDPLGPLLFCLAVHSVLLNIQSELCVGYLDDITIGGELEDVLGDLRMVERAGRDLGLILNHSKSEVVGAGMGELKALLAESFEFSITAPGEAIQLGAPLQSARWTVFSWQS